MKEVAMTEYEVVVAAIQQREQFHEELVEAGFFTSALLFPFKVLFYGCTFLIKLFAVLAIAVGVVGGASLALFGAFIWYVTRKVTGKVHSYADAKRLDPKKAANAKKYASDIADALRDPRVQSELRSNPRAAEAIHSSLDDLGEGYAAASSCIAIACSNLPDDGVVTADWQDFFQSPLFVGLAFVITVMLGGWGTALTSFLWYMAGMATHKWSSQAEAARHDKGQAAGAKKAAVQLRRKVNEPKLQEALRRSPAAAKLFHSTLKSLNV